MSSRLICILEVGRWEKGRGRGGSGRGGRRGRGGEEGRGGREKGEGGGACQDLQCRFRICSDALVTIIKILLDLLGTVLKKRYTGKEKDMAFLKGSENHVSGRRKESINYEAPSQTLITSSLPAQAEKLPCLSSLLLVISSVYG
jgi:hypothetical protein